MQGSARILIVGREDGDDKKLAQALRAGGYESSIGDITQGAEEISGKRRPDIVVLNMRSAEARRAPRAYLAFAEALKQSALSSRMRIMLVGADADIAMEDSARHIDDLLIGEINEVQLCHRIRSLIRLNTMHEELVRRLGTSAKYGHDAPPAIDPPCDIDNATVLVLGDASDFGIIETSLSKQATLIGALTSATALDYLTRRSFDAVIINTGRDAAAYAEFVNDIRRQSRLFNLPIVLLTDAAAMEDILALYETGITDAIAKPFSQEEIQIRLQTLVRESRFRDTLKRIYAQAKHFATSDALTGLYNRGFLLEHLSAVISDARRTSQSVSLAGLSIANMEQINSMLGYAGGDRLIRQVGEAIGLLIRGEDLACRYSGCRFAIMLPDTSVENAVHAVHRINGVVANTEFGVDGHYHPIAVDLDITIAGLETGDTADSLIKRCWASGKKSKPSQAAA